MLLHTIGLIHIVAHREQEQEEPRAEELVLAADEAVPEEAQGAVAAPPQGECYHSWKNVFLNPSNPV